MLKILVVLCFILLALIADWFVYGQESFISKTYRYSLYYYWVHMRRYYWQVMHDYGGGYMTPKLTRAQAIKHVSQAGENITGIDETLKVIFCRAKR